MRVFGKESSKQRTSNTKAHRREHAVFGSRKEARLLGSEGEHKVRKSQEK